MAADSFSTALQMRLKPLSPKQQLREFTTIVLEAVREVFRDGKLTKEDAGAVAIAAEQAFDIVAAYDLPIDDRLEAGIEAVIRASLHHAVTLLFDTLL